MGTKCAPRRAGMTSLYYVEVDGPDGLKHHVGPFTARAGAAAWLAQEKKNTSPRAGKSLDLKTVRQPP